MVRRWVSASDAVLRSLDNRWAWLLYLDGKPFYQSHLLCSIWGRRRDDFSWTPPSWSWLERARIGTIVPGYEIDGRLRKANRLTAVYLGEWQHAVDPSPSIPRIVPSDITSAELAVALFATADSAWVFCSFDENGQMDPLGSRPAKALRVSQDDESWVPGHWRHGDNRVADLVQGDDGVTRLVEGELVNHDLGTFVMFRVFSESEAGQRWDLMKARS